MDNPKAIAQLINQYLQSKLLPEDEELFKRWLDLHPANRIFLKKIIESGNLQKDILEFHKLINDMDLDLAKNNIAQRLIHEISQADNYPRLKSYKWKRLFWYSAACLATIFSTTYYFNRNVTRPKIYTDNVSEKKVDILPGTSKAILRVVNGNSIPLKESEDGIAVKNGIYYTNGDKVLDKRNLNQNQNALVLEVPVKNTYRITLSDGTRVWINAGSKLRFPANFPSNKREIELEGEAYFEVAKVMDKGVNVPFFVKSKSQKIKVLGTKFNVSAYHNENKIKTTLIEGEVAIYSDKPKMPSIKLTPGKQSTLNSDGFNVEKVDPSQAIAWKNDLFLFNDNDPREAFEQLARWYDIDIIYPSKGPIISFFGTIERNKRLSEVLEILKISGMSFKLKRHEGRVQLVILGE